MKRALATAAATAASMQGADWRPADRSESGVVERIPVLTQTVRTTGVAAMCGTPVQRRLAIAH